MRSRARSRCHSRRSLHLERTDIDLGIHDAIKTWAALIEERRGSKVWVASVNSRTAGQQCVGECRATVVLERAEQRLRIDLVSRAVQIPAGIITAEIEAMRRHRAAVIEKRSIRYAAVEDGITDTQRGGATKVGTGVIDGAARVSQVAT